MISELETDELEGSPPEGDNAKPAAKKKTPGRKPSPPSAEKDNKVIKLLEKNPLGMTLPEMAGGPRQLKKIRALRPMLAEAIKLGAIMPVSQRAGHTVYRLVKKMGPR
jgi:hypothetical protein